MLQTLSKFGCVFGLYALLLLAVNSQAADIVPFPGPQVVPPGAPQKIDLFLEPGPSAGDLGLIQYLRFRGLASVHLILSKALAQLGRQNLTTEERQRVEALLLLHVRRAPPNVTEDPALVSVVQNELQRLFIYFPNSGPVRDHMATLMTRFQLWTLRQLWLLDDLVSKPEALPDLIQVIFGMRTELSPLQVDELERNLRHVKPLGPLQIGALHGLGRLKTDDIEAALLSAAEEFAHFIAPPADGKSSVPMEHPYEVGYDYENQVFGETMDEILAEVRARRPSAVSIFDLARDRAANNAEARLFFTVALNPRFEWYDRNQWRDLADQARRQSATVVDLHGASKKCQDWLNNNQ